MKWTNFKIDKMYLDCIDEKGNCFIVYRASLEFFVIKLNYSALIFSDFQNISIEKSTLKKTPKPLISDLLHFKNTFLQLEGSWERKDDAISLLLYKDAQGRNLYWNCHHPKSLTHIVYKNNIFRGWGYAETLSLPFKPWHLPLEELRWGRFLSEKVTIIWIQWKGKYPLNKIICNGIIYEDAIFDENSVIFDNGRSILLFQEKVIIRKGKLSNVLSKMPWLKLIFNNKMLNTLEMKYKAKSSFSKDLNPLDKGWSLFEIVTMIK